jgi:membrane-bound ClpP family serine protease
MPRRLVAAVAALVLLIIGSIEKAKADDGQEPQPASPTNTPASPSNVPVDTGSAPPAQIATPASQLPSPVAPPPSTPRVPGPVISSVKVSPSGRVAKNIAIITIEGEIDEWTLYSVKRRIAKAQQDGADAIVFDVDSPGGEVFSCVLIATEIKKSTVPITVAWVNPKAYSGGAVVSLACRELVISDGAVLGDVLPIGVDSGGLRQIGREEREKFTAPVMADLVDSARRNGYDEAMVQAFARRGIPLWLVENTKTGRRLFVSREEYRLAVGEEPDELQPTVPRGLGPAPQPTRRERREGNAAVSGTGEKTDFTPAGPGFSPTLIGDVNTELSMKGSRPTRPNLKDPDQKGMYKPIEFVTDGSAPLTMRGTELVRYGIATAKIRSDEELKTYFGATNVVRLDQNWADMAARFLSHGSVKMFLIVVFLVALFVEMSHPGLTLPGGIAAICLVGLVLPPILTGIAGLWTLAAIVLGIVLIGVELFLTPGVAIIGVIGVLSLFAGLAGTFLVGPGNGLFPGAGRSSTDIGWAVATTFISLVVAGVVIGFLMRHLPQIPMLRRLILANEVDGGEEETPGSYAPSFSPDHPIQPGMKGIAVTPLRPAGRVQIGERIVDAVADGSFIDAGAKVKVLSSGGFRTTVALDDRADA